jgi:hypothetical protein
MSESSLLNNSTFSSTRSFRELNLKCSESSPYSYLTGEHGRRMHTTRRTDSSRSKATYVQASNSLQKDPNEIAKQQLHRSGRQ